MRPTGGGANTGGGGGGATRGSDHRNIDVSGASPFDPGGGGASAGGSGIVVIRIPGVREQDPFSSTVTITGRARYEDRAGGGLHFFHDGGSFDVDLVEHLRVRHSGTIGGTGDLVLAGSGRLELRAANTFSGLTRSRDAEATLAVIHADALRNLTLDMRAGDTGLIEFGEAIEYRVGGVRGTRALGLADRTLYVAPAAGVENSYTGTLTTDLLRRTGPGTQILSTVGSIGSIPVAADGEPIVLEQTINIAQPAPRPELDRTKGARPGEGGTEPPLATVAGRPVPADLSVDASGAGFEVGGDGWTIGLDVDASDGQVERSGDGVRITLARNGTFTATGSGMQPGTLTDVWMFSEATLLGVVTVDEDGTFALEASVDPRFISTGSHTLQVQGVGADGYVRAVKATVTIEERSRLDALTGGPLGRTVLLVLLLIGSAVGLLSWRSREPRAPTPPDAWESPER